MKPLSTSRTLCVSWRAQSGCVLLLYKLRVPTFLTLHAASVLPVPNFLLSHGRVLYSVKPFRHLCPPHLPSIEFP